MATKIVTNVTTGETWEEELTAEEISWLPSESQLAAEDLEYLRMIRNSKLQMCDWTQGSDVPNSIKTAWQTYRQQLRDLPASASPKLDEIFELDISSVNWPTKPS